MEIIVYFIIWFVLCILVSVVGKSREIGETASFFIAFFLSPIVGFIVVALSKDVQTAQVERTLLNKNNPNKVITPAWVSNSNEIIPTWLIERNNKIEFFINSGATKGEISLEFQRLGLTANEVNKYFGNPISKRFDEFYYKGENIISYKNENKIVEPVSVITQTENKNVDNKDRVNQLKKFFNDGIISKIEFIEELSKSGLSNEEIKIILT